jgi:predicted adenylyl cyclase CyaB
MELTIIEIKAKVPNQEEIRDTLKKNNAIFRGFDVQKDIYFNVPRGKLKIRRGSIKSYLVYYEREDKKGPKKSNIIRIESPDSELEKLLKTSLGVLIEVNKKRENYFIDNIKFHIDDVTDLGKFVEIEAVGENQGIDKLREQCEYYMSMLGIDQSSLISGSYSDLLLKIREK